jgi:hypothetical protein
VITAVRRDAAAGVAWEIVQPRCSRRRREDVEEVAGVVSHHSPAMPTACAPCPGKTIAIATDDQSSALTTARPM